MSLRRGLSLVLFASLLAAGPVRAATYTWTGANSSLWSDPGNWLEGTAPVWDPNAILVFPQSATSFTSTDDLAGTTYISDISFGYFASPYTIGAVPGASLAVFGGIGLSCGVQVDFGIPITFFGGTSHSIGLPGGLGCPGATVRLNAPISGAPPDSLWVSGVSNFGGGGVVTLSGDSSFSGETHLTTYGSSVNLIVTGSLASSAVTADSGTRIGGTGTLGTLAATANTWVGIGLAHVAPGTTASNGILHIAGDATLAGVFDVRLNGTNPAEYDQLQVGGATTVGGATSFWDTLSATVNFAPPLGTVFTIIQSTGPVSGTFTPGAFYLANCQALQVGYTPNSVTLTSVMGGPPLTDVVIAAPGGPLTFCNGTGSLATVSETGGCNNTHQWGYRTVSGGAITAIAGQTGASYLINGADFPGTGSFYLVETTTPVGGTPVTSNELTVLVLSLTTGTVSAPTTICAEQPVQLHATGGPTCSWLPTTGLSDPNSCDPVARPSTTTTYTASFSGVCAATNQPAVTLTVLPQPASKFYTLAPCRAVDTRLPDGPLGGPQLAAGAARSFVLTGACGVPATAKSVAANVTIASPTSSGDLRIHPANLALPEATTISFFASQNRANNAMLALPCDGTGAVDVLNESTQPVDLIVDVVGYFE